MLVHISGTAELFSLGLLSQCVWMAGWTPEASSTQMTQRMCLRLIGVSAALLVVVSDEDCRPQEVCAKPTVGSGTRKSKAG